MGWANKMKGGVIMENKCEYILIDKNDFLMYLEDAQPTIANVKINFDITDENFKGRGLKNYIPRHGITFINCDLSGIKIDLKYLSNSRIRNCNFDNTVFTNSPIFSNSCISYSSFNSADLSQACFEACVFERNDFSDANLTDTNFVGASFKEDTLNNIKARNSNFSNADLAGIDLTFSVGIGVTIAVVYTIIFPKARRMLVEAVYLFLMFIICSFDKWPKDNRHVMFSASGKIVVKVNEYLLKYSDKGRLFFIDELSVNDFIYQLTAYIQQNVSVIDKIKLCFIPGHRLHKYFISEKDFIKSFEA